MWPLTAELPHADRQTDRQTDRQEKVTVIFRNNVAKAPIDGEMKATESLSITLNPLYFTEILNEWLPTRTCSSTYTVTDLWGALKLKGGKQKITKLR
jgi:hypothetical protein